MNAKQRKALQGYVDEMRPLLGLAEWEVSVSDQPTVEEAHVATIYPVWGTRQANVRFSKTFFTHAPSFQRETVIHELLHCVFAQTQHQVEFILPQHASDEHVGALFHAMWDQAHEYAIDGLAVAIAPRFPLPSLP